MKRVMRTLLLSTLLLTPGLAQGDDGVLHLPIGDVERRERVAELRLDTLTATEDGHLLSPADLAQKLKDVRLVLMGESHTSMEFHRAQLTLIEELHRAGRKVLVGLEMFPYTAQPHLNQWSHGLLTERGFVELADWYSNWGYNWNYYREIFLFARQNSLRMVAINTPRPMVTAVREKGIEQLSPEERAHIPERIDTDNEEHLRLFKAFFPEDDGFHSGLSDEQWQGMLAAQCTWDASMAFNAIRALESEDASSIMVVLVGFGHVAYGLGIERQAALWSDEPIISVIPVVMEGEEAQPIRNIQASFANYVWGLPPEQYPFFPELGISLRVSGEDRAVSAIQVSSESPAAVAGVLKGDVLLEFDGAPVRGRSSLNQAVAEKRWGDRGVLRVKRGEEEIQIIVHFRRQLDSGESSN